LNRFESLLRYFPHPVLVLDAGCGDCDTAQQYRSQWEKSGIIGLDQNSDGLKRAFHREPSIHWLCADLTQLPFAPHPQFDLILARHPNVDGVPSTWARFFETVPTLLLPGGHLIVTTYSALESDKVRQWLAPAPNLLEIPIEGLPPSDLVGHDAWVRVYCRKP